jgi:hypothetical protein
VIINNKHIESTELSYPSGKVKCLLGYFPRYEDTKNCYINDYHFTGKFGTAILFSEIFTAEFLTAFYDLRGNYEKMLTIKDYNSSGIEKYDTSLNDHVYSSALKYFKTYPKDIDQKVDMIISSKVNINQLNY